MFIENLVGLCNEKNEFFSDIHRVGYFNITFLKFSQSI